MGTHWQHIYWQQRWWWRWSWWPFWGMDRARDTALSKIWPTLGQTEENKPCEQFHQPGFWKGHRSSIMRGRTISNGFFRWQSLRLSARVISVLHFHPQTNLLLPRLLTVHISVSTAKQMCSLPRTDNKLYTFLYFHRELSTICTPTLIC